MWVFNNDISISITCLPMRPDSSSRYRRYINHSLTYLLTIAACFAVVSRLYHLFLVFLSTAHTLQKFLSKKLWSKKSSAYTYCTQICKTKIYLLLKPTTLVRDKNAKYINIITLNITALMHYSKMGAKNELQTVKMLYTSSWFILDNSLDYEICHVCLHRNLLLSYQWMQRSRHHGFPSWLPSRQAQCHCHQYGCRPLLLQLLLVEISSLLTVEQSTAHQSHSHC